MATQEGNNVFVCAVNGNFDDAQTGVKTIFTDKEYEDILLSQKKALSSANSINWGRLCPQIVYYFSAYCDMLKDGEIALGEKVNVCVPTGNFGNILAAYYAKRMGLPIKKLICASNKNNVLTDFINTGTYDRNREFFTTTSPSMDILISSNIERLLCMVSDANGKLVKEYMDALKKHGTYTVSDTIKARITEDFYGGFADEETCAKTLKDTYETFGYVVDPHTAVAVAVHNAYVQKTGDSAKTIIASTASPFKFNGAVLSALGSEVSDTDEFGMLEKLAKDYCLQIPTQLKSLEKKKVRFETVCEKDSMKDVVDAYLKNIR